VEMIGAHHGELIGAPFSVSGSDAGSGSKATPTPQYSLGNVDRAGRRSLAFVVAVVAIALIRTP
uniref:Uncharacterized protein n=1 Tax=Aegilops tauschii subsp. strangulata TaxID=200361 RepID=A0A453M1R9_AEGTS